MTSRIVLLFIVGLLSACGGSKVSEDALRSYEISCIKSGFAVDTPEYTDCVTSHYKKAQAEQDRRRESLQKP